MKTLKQLAFLLIGLTFATMTFAGQHQSMSTDSKTIAQVAASNKNFSTLVAALKAAGLVDVLNKPGSYTVFAPTNDAFSKLPKGTLAALLKPENKDKLKNILLYHVVKGKVMAADVKPGDVATMEGGDIKITTDNGKVMINGNTQVTKTDIVASNGVIHVINNVLLPPKN